MKHIAKERRNSKRFRLRLAVVFSWRDERGVLQSGDGCCSNISSRGIYVHTRCAPPPGNSVEMNVFLPQPAYEIRAVEIYAKGQVMRLDQGPQNQVCGFASMNRTVLIRESMEHALEGKDSDVRNSSAARNARISDYPDLEGLQTTPKNRVRL